MNNETIKRTMDAEDMIEMLINREAKEQLKIQAEMYEEMLKESNEQFEKEKRDMIEQNEKLKRQLEALQNKK